MPDQPDNANPSTSDEETDGLRQLLVDIEDPASDEFVGRVRRSIHRRTTVAQLTSFGWRMPGSVLAELLRVLRYLPESFGKGPDRWK